MQNITLGQISTVILSLGAFIGGIEYLLIRFKTLFKNVLNKELEPIKKDIKSNELQTCMNYLVVAIEKAKKDKYMSSVEKQRFYEMYDIYTNKYHKNSYIHSEVEDLEKSNIL